MIKKIKTIIFSRFKKPNTESFVEERKKVCKKCNFNSKNKESISFKMKCLKNLSNLLTFITRVKRKEDLGQCIHPNCGCEIYFKTQEKLEECPINKWEK